MDIKLFNSLTNKIEIFSPIKKGEVSMYVCGSTVYDSPHIGNLRPMIVFDVLRRLFIYNGYKVTYVSNYTDVDDKIINKAIKENIDEMSVANRYINEINEIIKNINNLPATKNPRVTEYMDKIINYIDNLVKSNHAYVLDGDVYFRIKSINDYGELSKINIDQLNIGARIEENKGKESPLDFALWKKTDKGIKWKSPWGEGRPGWHTECCVMIDSIFNGEMIDIHGGGFDLKFPHHENEIAQAKATHNNKIAHYWIHNGFVTFDDNKMSKSLGNVILAKYAIKDYGANVVRLALLSSHYRAPVKFNQETLAMAKTEIEKMSSTYNKLAVLLQKKLVDLSTQNKANIENFVSSLADDLNISNALSSLYDVMKSINNEMRNKVIDLNKLKDYFFMLKDMFSLLGFNIKYVNLTKDDYQLFKDYQTARDNKDYQKSDEIRKILLEKHLI